MLIKEFKERMAAGLRKMDIKPDFIALIVERFDNEEWDAPEFSGISIIKTYISVNSGYDGDDFTAIPCFKSNIDEKNISMQVYFFQRGFTEYNYKSQTIK